MEWKCIKWGDWVELVENVPLKSGTPFGVPQCPVYYVKLSSQNVTMHCFVNWANFAFLNSDHTVLGNKVKIFQVQL